MCRSALNHGELRGGSSLLSGLSMDVAGKGGLVIGDHPTSIKAPHVCSGLNAQQLRNQG